MSVQSAQIDGGATLNGGGQALYAAYRLFGTALSPLLAAGFLCAPRGRRRFAERFGAWGELSPVEWWFHGASVGEVQGLLPVIRELRAVNQNERFLLSATSPTGLDKGEGIVEERRILPLDIPWCVNRAFSSITGAGAPLPQLVLCETELWPVMLHQALRRGVRCSLINARVSDYTFNRYLSLRGLFAPLLQGCALVCVPNEEQRARYEELGVAPERIVLTGHTKYDAAPKVTTNEQRATLYREFFPSSVAEVPVVVLGSIRPGEETWWFNALEHVWGSGGRIKVIVAPRHAEKFEYFWEKIKSLGRRAVRWSQHHESQRGEQGSADAEIVLLDTMGRLEDAYAIAQLAFIGATLVNIGGHNPLEAAMYGVPVAVGPYTSVIRDVISELRAESAVHDVDSPDDVDGLLARVVSRDRGMLECGKRGVKVCERHRGASARVAQLLTERSCGDEAA